jgi:hypothetical protein
MALEGQFTILRTVMHHPPQCSGTIPGRAVSSYTFLVGIDKNVVLIHAGPKREIFSGPEDCISNPFNGHQQTTFSIHFDSPTHHISTLSPQ